MRPSSSDSAKRLVEAQNKTGLVVMAAPPKLGIAMYMSIGMKSAHGAMRTLSLSFNNDGPLWSACCE
jgi:hypothetical protein